MQILPEFCSTLPERSCRVQAYVDPRGQVKSLGIYSAETSKGKALKLVCETLGIAPEDVVAIGDNLADMPMLDFAGIGITMGNAPEGMRNKAEYIVPTNDEKGVRWAVEKFVLSA